MTKEERLAKLAQINASDASPHQKILDIQKFVEGEQNAEEQIGKDQIEQEKRNITSKVQVTDLGKLEQAILSLKPDDQSSETIPIDLSVINESLGKIADELKKGPDIKITLKIV